MRRWSREDLDRVRAFFIVGAPRCGTTTLASMLKGHPAVCFAVPKEPHYFSRLPEAWSPERVLADYLPAYFRHWDGAAPVLGKGSPSYLYADRAIEAIEACFPGARYIVMARSPLQLVPSHHKRMLYTLDEDEPDLARAWALQAERRGGRRVPRRYRDPRLLDYEGAGRVGARCEALLRQVGRDRVRFILLDDLRADPLGTYRGALRFLSLEDDGRTTLPRRNESQAVRNLPLHLLLSHPRSEVTRLALARLRRSRFRLVGGLVKRLRRASREAAAPDPLTPELREMLGRTFADDVLILSRVVGRDLGHWLDPERAAGKPLATPQDPGTPTGWSGDAVPDACR